MIVLVSAIIYLAPVDPARLTFGQRMDNSSVELKQKELMLDQPLWKQMTAYLNDISPIGIVDVGEYRKKGLWIAPISKFEKGSLAIKQPYLRYSYQSGRSVSSMLRDAIPKTVILATVAMIMAVILGIIFGVIAALFHGSWLDHGIIAISTLGISVPSYVSAIVLALVFGYMLGDVTGLNIQGSIFDLNDMGDEVVIWKNILLPAVALGIRPLSIITQLMRSSLLDVLSMDYIRTAKAKGLAFGDVIRRHALRNSFNPVLTAVTGWFASLLAGTFFVEHVFNFKGVGEMTVNALINYDIPVILACVIFICLVFITLNILVDILYKVIDPKVQ